MEPEKLKAGINESRIDTEVITILGQRGSGKSSWLKKKLPEIPRFILWDTLGEYDGFERFEDLDSLYRYIHANQSGVFQAVYVTEKDPEDFGPVCTIAGAVGPCYFIIEEVDTYATPTYCPQELMTLLKKGRHYGVSMAFVSRRPAEIHRMITAQSNRFVIFRILEGRDIQYLKSILGPEADKLPALETLHYMDWIHGQIEYGEVKW